MKITILILTISLLIGSRQSYAHPGRTDNTGGHVCRSNCTNWGLQTDEYHIHTANGYTNSSGISYDKKGNALSTPTSEPLSEAEPEPEAINTPKPPVFAAKPELTPEPTLAPTPIPTPTTETSTEQIATRESVAQKETLEDKKAEEITTPPILPIETKQVAANRNNEDSNVGGGLATLIIIGSGAHLWSKRRKKK